MNRKKWIYNIPHTGLKVVTKYSAVCRLHWRGDAVFVIDHGKLRPMIQHHFSKYIPNV